MKDKTTIQCRVGGSGPWILNEQGENIIEEHTLLTGHEDYTASDGGSIRLPAPPFHIICSCGFETENRLAWENHIRDVEYQHAFRRVIPKVKRVVQP